MKSNPLNKTRQRRLTLLLRKYQSNEAAGEKWNVSPQQISHYVNAHRNLGEKVAARIELSEGLPAGWLSNASDEIVTQMAIAPVVNIGKMVSAKAGQFVRVAHWEEGISNVISAVDGNTVKKDVLIEQSWLDGNNLTIADVCQMEVPGNSMSPRYNQGDTVILNKSYGKLVSGDVYAIAIDGEAILRSIIKNPDGTLTLKSAKPDDYPSWNVKADDISGLDILGRAAKLLADL